MPDFSPPTLRPMLQARQYAVAAGTPLATLAGVRMLERGGNAVDAGVAAGICINVTQPDMTNFGGVAPIIIYLAETREVVTISGLGRWPKAARLEYFRDELGGELPRGLPRSIVPSACDAWLTALARYGRLSLAEVLQPAIQLAADGFAVHRFLAHNLRSFNERLAHWGSTDYLRPDGSPLEPGDLLRQPQLAATFEALVEAERGAAHLGRAGAIMAARDLFYKGELAERISRFSRENGGFIAYDDLAEFSVKVEPPVRTSYRGHEVYACGPWCQGPVVPQTLNILEQFDAAALGHNSPAYLHVLTEALKASFADREAYYGDPDFVRVPMDGLLHKEYARRWAARISDQAAPGMPEPGDPWAYEGEAGLVGAGAPAARPGPIGTDTSYCCVVDADGNGFSATPSDGVGSCPIVPGVGTVVSPRGDQSRLDPRHPASLQPGKRPRLTPSPALMLKDGVLEMTFGTPGGDVQPQAMVQLVANVVDFGLDPQAAIEAPRISSYSFPGSFYPHNYNPGLLKAESRIPAATLADLAARGHRVEVWPDYTALAGALGAILVGSRWGRLVAGADPRRVAYAIGW
jgi:gamma-glutamyltranspeptidase / glutathione hydrolase